MKRFLAACALLIAATTANAGGLGLRSFAPPEATRFLNVAEEQGCQLSQVDEASYSSLFISLIKDNLFSHFDVLGVPGMSPDPRCAFINLANPSGPKGTVFGGVDVEPYSCATGDSSTNGYVDLGIKSTQLTKFQQNDAHLSVWACSVMGAEDNPDIGLVGGGTHNLWLDIASPSGIMTTRLNSTTNNNGSNVGANTILMNSADRTDANTVLIYQGGLLTTTASSTSNAKNSNNIGLFLRNNPAVYSDNAIASYAIGSHLSAADEMHMEFDIGLALERVGAVPSPPNSDNCGTGNCLPAFFSGSGAGTANAQALANLSRIVEQTNPPATDAVTEATYKFFPGNVFASLTIRSCQTSTYSKGVCEAFLFGNRYNNSDHLGRTASPNPISPVVNDANGKRIAQQFTTISRADAATLARASFLLGFAAHDTVVFNGVTYHVGWLDFTEAAGIPDANVLYFDSIDGTPNLVDQASALCTDETTWPPYCVLTDTVILTQGRLADVPSSLRGGLFIDFEAQDGHSCPQTTAVATMLAIMTHAKGEKLDWYTNPLDGGTAVFNGYCNVGTGGANLDAVLSAVDYFDPILLPGADPVASLTKQLSFFAAPINSKIMPVSYLKNMTVTQAGSLGAYIVANHMAGTTIFYGGVLPGGECSRPTIEKAAAVFGLSAC